MTHYVFETIVRDTETDTLYSAEHSVESKYGEISAYWDAAEDLGEKAVRDAAAQVPADEIEGDIFDRFVLQNVRNADKNRETFRVSGEWNNSGSPFRLNVEAVDEWDAEFQALWKLALDDDYENIPDVQDNLDMWSETVRRATVTNVFAVNAKKVDAAHSDAESGLAFYRAVMAANTLEEAQDAARVWGEQFDLPEEHKTKLG